MGRFHRRLQWKTFGLAFAISLYGGASKAQVMRSSYRAEHGGLAAQSKSKWNFRPFRTSMA